MRCVAALVWQIESIFQAVSARPILTFLIPGNFQPIFRAGLVFDPVWHNLTLLQVTTGNLVFKSLASVQQRPLGSPQPPSGHPITHWHLSKSAPLPNLSHLSNTFGRGVPRLPSEPQGLPGRRGRSPKRRQSPLRPTRPGPSSPTRFPWRLTKTSP